MRRDCSFRLAARAVSFLALSASLAVAQEAADSRVELARALQAGAVYVEKYERAFSTVIAEEDYVQRVRTSQGGRILETRRLRSDTLLASAGEIGWIWFRDVFEVDGQTVRERDSRLQDLFLKPTPDSRAQAARITEESARFNVGALQRTINVPTLALLFLRADEQARSRFSFERTTRVGGRETAQIRFVEVAEPRLIRTPDDTPARGRLWVAPGGEVLRTELEIGTAGSRGVITVSYERDEKLGMLVPIAMAEEFAIPLRGTQSLENPSTITSTPGSRPTAGQHLEGRAKYSRFRQFSVMTTTIIGDGKGWE
jgi:hypothetical protein